MKAPIEQRVECSVILIYGPSFDSKYDNDSIISRPAGTGFLVSKKDRLLITCTHVTSTDDGSGTRKYLNPAKEIQFNFVVDNKNDEREPRLAKLIDYIPFHEGDLCVYEAVENEAWHKAFKMEADKILANELPFVKNEDDLLPKRLKFCTIGSTPNEPATLSKTARGEVEPTKNGGGTVYTCLLLQLSSNQLRRGFSGAPVVVEANGEVGVIGVVTWVEGRPELGGSAIPASVALEKFRDLLDKSERVAKPNLAFYYTGGSTVIKHHWLGINPSLFWGVNRAPFVGIFIGDFDHKQLQIVEKCLLTEGAVSPSNVKMPPQRVWNGPYFNVVDVPPLAAIPIAPNEIIGIIFKWEKDSDFLYLENQVAGYLDKGVASVIIMPDLRMAKNFIEDWNDIGQERHLLEVLDGTYQVSVPDDWKADFNDSNHRLAKSHEGDLHYLAAALRFGSMEGASIEGVKSQFINEDKEYLQAQRIFNLDQLHDAHFESFTPKCFEIALLSGKSIDLIKVPPMLWAKKEWAKVLARIFWSQHNIQNAITILKEMPILARWTLLGIQRENIYTNLTPTHTRARSLWLQ